MIKHWFSSGLLLAAIVGMPTGAIAQSTIQEVQTVNSTTLSGQITHLSGDDFILNDGTGQILVEAESRILRQANLSVGEQVTVAGTLEENTLEAFRITRESGEEIYVFDD